MDLDMAIKDAPGIYKRYKSRLEKLGITKFLDFLYHIPSRYEDYSLIAKISSLQVGERVTIQGYVSEIKNTYTRRFMTIQKAIVSDETGKIDVTWFNQPYLVKTIQPGQTISLAGVVQQFQKRPIMQSPDYEIVSENQQLIHTGKLVPIYPETKGVSSKWLRRQVHTLIEHNQNLPDHIPDSILEENNFFTLSDALQKIHFPKTVEEARAAKERLSFDELFFLQLQGLARKQEWKSVITGHSLEIEKNTKLIRAFIDNLPFKLTGAQEKAVSEILEDLSQDKPMNRLLQGDVGSGKTVVSAIAIYTAYLSGYSSVLMAPTEILALQHYKTLRALLSPYTAIDIVTSSRKLKVPTERAEANNVLVGTHAVLQKKITQEKLGLVVIDEQQRFGVEQRSLIRQKGDNPHFLTMTATPIPRTIALTLYGDLDVSYLYQMPVGRKKIKTWLVPTKKRQAAYKWIRKQIKETDSQVFVICPFIEESESMQTVKAATKEFEKLQKEIFPDLKIGLLHGKLKAKEKEEVLVLFKEKKFDILVATPIVEVGIDIPNATIIVIEGAERFGLANLHQLRGRVGRADMQSYCLLFTESESIQTRSRLQAMETMHSGAALAELDLKLRGPGDIFGKAQHGLPKLRVASFSDSALISRARHQAHKIFPKLSQFPLLLDKLSQESAAVSPD